MFAADSRCCLLQLRLLRERRLDVSPPVLAAANYGDLAQHFGDPQHLRRRCLTTERHALPAADRAQARALIDPRGRWERLAELPGADELLAAWQERAAALARYRARLDPRWSTPDTALSALLHLHHNRLLGADRTAEERSLALARRTVRAYWSREAARRAAGTPRSPDVPSTDRHPTILPGAAL